MSDENFGMFNRLPAEIRSMIWEYSLPEARVYEVLDAPHAKQKTPARDGLMFANVHPEPPPALAAVCRESRFYVLRHYKPLTLGRTTKFVDLSRDILLLEPYLLVKRLHRTLHFMSQIPLVRDNISCLALGTSYGVYTGICHPVLSWKVSKNNMGKLLSALSQFTKLKTLIFVVHQEFQFEFDFRYPPSYPIQSAPPPPVMALPPPTTGTTITRATGMVTQAPPPSMHAATSLPPPPPAPHQVNMTPVNAPRPQIVHQAYRFKFDIEANINYHPRRPHLNELLYYPLDMEEDKDDWEAAARALAATGHAGLEEEESEWCDPWPTNDDWRRFRKRFQRAVLISLEMGLGAGFSRENLPAVKGASLLWRYTQGDERVPCQ
jgi:hypothetical protein